MKQIYYVIQTLLRRRGSNVIKVISLGLALTMSILLFARVAFEKSCNTCYKDYDQLYQVFSIWTINGERDKEPSEMNLPVVAGTILESFPDEVEAAVTICKYMVTGPLYNGSVRFSDNKIMADSLFFRTMGIEVLTGDAVRELQQKDVVFLSDRLARKIFGNENPIGKVISYDKQIQLTVKGTYVAVPENSTMNPEAVISLATAWSRGWDDNNWKGGDSYFQYIRFRPGAKVDIEKFSSRLDTMVQNHVPQDLMQGVGCILFVKSIYDVYQDSDITKRMVYIMSIL